MKGSNVLAMVIVSLSAALMITALTLFGR